MKTPPLLLATALMFWGWQTGLWFFAIPMAIILAGSRFVQSRWDFSTDDIKRIANLCLVVMVALTVYLLISTRSFYIVYTILQWLPIIAFPLVAAQIYAVNDHIKLTTLFLIFNDAQTGQQSNHFTLNLTFPYVAVCILAASNANTENISFYLGLLVITAIVLWNVRSRRFSPITWLCLFFIAGSIGFIGQIGLHQLHLKVEDQVVAWFSNAIGQEINAFKKETSIGEIGVLKQSNDIVFRVDSENHNSVPGLLREATYNKYQSAIWIAVNPGFVPVKPENDKTTWRLGNLTNNSSITIYGTLNNGKGILRVADGTVEINDLPVSEMEKNKYGTIKVSGKVNDLAYKIKFNQDFALDSSPTVDDLQIPKGEASAINEIVQKLNVQGKSPVEILKIVDAFLIKNYRYSLQLTGKDTAATPLSTFLLKTRAGHCEYFASATTLILRALGIPARYTVGYSVHEFSNLEQQYIVRSRHAHAWTMVYINDKWQVFDTTPADWTSIENAGFSNRFYRISAIWDFWGFKISSWLRQLRSSGMINYIWWLLLPIFLLMLKKSVPQKAVKRVFKPQEISAINHKQERVNQDSEFYLVEQALIELGFARNPAESLKSWIARIKRENPTSELMDELSSLIELHYRYRFDPQGVEDVERENLKSAVNSWLNQLKIKN